MLTIGLEGADVEKQLRDFGTRNLGRSADAARATINWARDEVKRRWAIDVRSAGNFSGRWVDALQGEITPRVGRTRRISLTFAMRGIPYWRIHEYGGIIKGKPLLWIPLPWTGLKVRARDYKGRLFRVDRKSGGNPLLMSPDGEAKYVGVEQVRLKKRFHLRKIIREVGKQMGPRYRTEYRRLKGR